jgi:hypothetical protein
MPFLGHPQRLVALGFISLLAFLSLLAPFLSTKLSTSRFYPEKSPTWLLLTMSDARSQLRRNIIRATWQTLYPHPAFTNRFLISNPGENWMPVIEHENSTYGDLIMLGHLEESRLLANTIKQFECLKYLAESESQWDFMSKIDDDSFLDALSFYKEFILPRKEDPSHARTIIARRLNHHNPDYIYPGGQFYTLSWALVPLLAQLYDKNPIMDEHEDVLVGRYMYEAREPFEFVQLDNRRAFDYDRENDDKLAWSHNISHGAINPHSIKSDEVYLSVAALYDKSGVVAA